MYVMQMINIVFSHFCGKFITYLETKLSCGEWRGGGGWYEEGIKHISSVRTNCVIFWWFLEVLQGCVLRKFEFEGSLLVVPYPVKSRVPSINMISE